jgi:hypothetical protein
VLLLLLSMQLRQGRELRSRTINNNNNPEFDEVHKLLIDDVDTQVKGGGVYGVSKGNVGLCSSTLQQACGRLPHVCGADVCVCDQQCDQQLPLV